MIAIEISDRFWDGERYKRLKASISDGKNIYHYLADDRGKDLPLVERFRRCSVAVTRAQIVEGTIQVNGALRLE